MALETMTIKQARQLLPEDEQKGYGTTGKALRKLMEVADIELGGLGVDTLQSDRYRSRLGVKIYYTDENFKRVWRGVKDTGDGIDLDKLREKVEELKALKAASDEAIKNKRDRQKRQANAKADTEREVKRLLAENGYDDGGLRYLSGVYLGERGTTARRRVELNARTSGVEMKFRVSPEKMIQILDLLND